jgi:hypothetical protein
LGISMAEALLGIAAALTLFIAVMWVVECGTWLRRDARVL